MGAASEQLEPIKETIESDHMYTKCRSKSGSSPLHAQTSGAETATITVDSQIMDVDGILIASIDTLQQELDDQWSDGVCSPHSSSIASPSSGLSDDELGWNDWPGTLTALDLFPQLSC